MIDLDESGFGIERGFDERRIFDIIQSAKRTVKNVRPSPPVPKRPIPRQIRQPQKKRTPRREGEVMISRKELDRLKSLEKEVVDGRLIRIPSYRELFYEGLRRKVWRGSGRARSITLPKGIGWEREDGVVILPVASRYYSRGMLLMINLGNRGGDDTK